MQRELLEDKFVKGLRTEGASPFFVEIASIKRYK